MKSTARISTLPSGSFPMESAQSAHDNGDNTYTVVVKVGYIAKRTMTVEVSENGYQRVKAHLEAQKALQSTA